MGSDQPKASIKFLGLDHHVSVEGRDGMRITAALRVRNLAGRAGWLVAYFRKDYGITPLKDTNGAYAWKGRVVATAAVTPQHDDTRFERLELLLPYEELHLPEDAYHRCQFTLCYYADLPDRGCVKIRTASEQQDFLYPPEQVLIENVIPDFSPVGGVPGMSIFLSLRVWGLKDRRGWMVAEFYDNYGRPYPDTDGNYGWHGTVAAKADLTPLYDDTRWEKIHLFLPAEQLHVPSGVRYAGHAVLTFYADLPEPFGVLPVHAHGGKYGFTYYDQPAPPPPPSFDTGGPNAAPYDQAPQWRPPLEQPGWFARTFGTTCPNCGRTGYAGKTGTRRVGSRTVWRRERRVARSYDPTSPPRVGKGPVETHYDADVPRDVPIFEVKHYCRACDYSWTTTV